MKISWKVLLIGLATATLLFSCGNSTSAASADTKAVDPAPAEAPATSGNNWDSYLTDYSSAVDSLVKAMKKQKEKPDDMTVLADLANVNAKLLPLAQKLQGAQAELTPAQLEKMIAIAAKMATAGQ